MAEKVRGYRCDRDTYETFKDAAKKDGMSIQAWVLRSLNATVARRRSAGEFREDATLRRQLRRKALDGAIMNIQAAMSHEEM